MVLDGKKGDGKRKKRENGVGSGPVFMISVCGIEPTSGLFSHQDQWVSGRRVVIAAGRMRGTYGGLGRQPNQQRTDPSSSAQSNRGLHLPLASS